MFLAVLLPPRAPSIPIRRISKHEVNRLKLRQNLTAVAVIDRDPAALVVRLHLIDLVNPESASAPVDGFGLTLGKGES